MCNDFGIKHPITVIAQKFAVAEIPLLFPTGLPNLEPREDIRPTDPALVVRSGAAGAEGATLRWGFQPARPKAGPVINFRSDGRRFGPGRCLIPVSHFFEFNGDRYPKTKWRFTLEGEDLFCIAGLWRPAAGDWPESFTMLTTAPGADIAPYHDRQPAVLRQDQWRRWLDPAEPAEGLVGPLPGGSLKVEKVR